MEADLTWLHHISHSNALLISFLFLIYKELTASLKAIPKCTWVSGSFSYLLHWFQQVAQLSQRDHATPKVS